MKNYLITATAIVFTLAMGIPGTGMAEPDPHSGKKGLIFTGATVAGGLLGGPIGFLAGAFTGVWLGENVARGYEYDGLEQELADTKNSSRVLERQLEQRLLAANEATAQYQRLASETLRFQVLFHTGESALLAESENRVAQLARFLAEQPDINVLLSGYADPRGDDTYNEQLSSQRVESITELLTAWGVAGNRITTRSFGASQSQAADKDYDAYALERRVTIELQPAIDQDSVDQSSVAQVATP